MTEEYALELHFGECRSHVRITNSLEGEDKPKDMAQAWLDGDTAEYERLLAEHIRRMPKHEPPAPKPTRQRKWCHTTNSPGVRGRRRVLDWSRIPLLRAEGHSLAAIAGILGCGKTQVFRALSYMTVRGVK